MGLPFDIETLKSMLASLPSTSGILIGWTLTALAISIALHLYITSSRVVPSGIPWIVDVVPKTSTWSLSSLSKLLSGHIQGHLRDLTEGIELTAAGYKKFSKRDAIYVAPSYMDWHGEVVLPPSQIRWLADQPEHEFSLKEALEGATQFRYTSPGAYDFSRPFHVEAINKVRLDLCVDDMYEAMSTVIDRDWGMDENEYVSNNVFKLNEVLVETDARLFYGLRLAQNEDFLESAYMFITTITAKAISIRLFPDLLKPIFGRLLTRDLKRYKKNCLNYIQPLIKEAMTKELPAKPTLLEIIAKLAAKSDDKLDRDPYNIATRLLTAHYVGVETSLHTIVGAFVDILSAPRAVYDELLEEAERIHASLTNRVWTKHAVDKLVKIDSAIRESMRLRTFKAKSLNRVVANPKGITLPTGQHLPKGTKVGVATLAMHQDEDIYSNALAYDAFRFCRDRSGEAPDKVTKGNVVTGMVNTSETWLAFGLGRHACPGRHMAACQLKLITAYFLLNYEVKALEERPENFKFCDFNVAPGAELWTKRKKRV